MGYQAKRVPLDFDWPLHHRWKGYINPFDVDSVPCPACSDYPGFSAAMQRLRNEWHGAEKFRPESNSSAPFRPDDAVILQAVRHEVGSFDGTSTLATERGLAAQLCEKVNSQWRYHLSDDDIHILAENGCLLDFTHEWSSKAGPEPKEPPYVPMPREVNDASVLGRFFDEGSQLTLFSTKCKLLGHPIKCSECEGYRRLWPTLELRKSSGMWQPHDPPVGDGFQMWSSDQGCSLSPVFLEAKELAKWLTEVGPPENLDISPTFDAWLSLIEKKWPIPAFIFNGTAMQAGSTVKANSTLRAK